ncbi:hypothetical protein [Paracidobacterium acidisoli]|uniref:DNA-directed RNA polymerase subunit omega n=1 Tax=Paracidobacterium acidisoli TaxID=2303751 RepID=A0A372IQY3_9BACT|nr:hypothetical protein [Paracidobacterium acidisoli]MBT9331558.1 hypothetical protein [Paracidobacterium acidisoli]
MRSELVYSAGLQVKNRFLLSTIVIHAVRRLHIDSTRTEDTANSVFSEVARGRYVDVTMGPVARPVPIEPVLAIPAA